MTARACAVAPALVIIARTRVVLLPGWTVPLSAVILAALLAVLATTVAVLAVTVASRPRRPAAACCGRCGDGSARADIPPASLTHPRPMARRGENGRRRPVTVLSMRLWDGTRGGAS